MGTHFVYIDTLLKHVIYVKQFFNVVVHWSVIGFFGNTFNIFEGIPQTPFPLCYAPDCRVVVHDRGDVICVLIYNVYNISYNISRLCKSRKR